MEREINLRNDNDLVIPFARTENIKKLPYYSLPIEWNKLGDIRFQHNPFTFKLVLKNHLSGNLNFGNMRIDEIQEMTL